MNIKSVMKNLIKKGPIKTWKLHQERKREKIRQEKMAEMQREIIQRVCEGSFEECKGLFVDRLNSCTFCTL